ncbi:MAG: hypothetical protein J0L75_00295 [Spirochaetes bacterium]|nr:hypothetical protein [Spirochaetota bacterium]
MNETQSPGRISPSSGLAIALIALAMAGFAQPAPGSAALTIRVACVGEFSATNWELWEARQRPDGSFSDLDYRAEPGSNFQLPLAYQRLFSMAQAWVSPRSPHAGDVGLSNRIRLGLAFASETPLAKKRPGESVAWRRQVFLEPGRLGPLLALVAPRLDSQSLKASLVLAKACCAPPFQQSGSPLLEHCMARLYYAAATGDGSALDRVRGEMEGLFLPSWDPDRAGAQIDGSWMAGGVLDLGGEGIFWADQLGRYERLVEGSSAQLSNQTRLAIDRFLRQGAAWVHASPALRIAFRRNPTIAAESLPPQQGPPPPEGVQAFPVGDAAAFRSGNLFVGVRMVSRRTHPWEWRPGDGEGPWHGADGATWIGALQEPLLLEGFDWNRVPGTTLLVRPGKKYEGSPVKAESPFTGFAGALASGASGVAAQALDSRDELSPNTGLAAHKAWFFFSNHAALCLGHGITASLPLRAETVVDQRLGASPPAGLLPDGGVQKLDGTASLTSGFLSYFFPAGGPLRGMRKPGNAGYTLWFDHGPKASNASYAYGVLPAGDASALALAAEGKTLRILSHTPRVMAVRDERSGETGYAFFAPAEVDDFSAARPCIAWTRQQGNLRTLRVSDPAQLREDLTVRLRGLWKAVDLPPKCSVKRAPGGLVIRLAVTNGLPLTASFLENTNWPPTAADESKPRK